MNFYHKIFAIRDFGSIFLIKMLEEIAGRSKKNSKKVTKLAQCLQNILYKTLAAIDFEFALDEL